MKDSDFEGLVAGLEQQGLTKTAIARETGLSYSTVWRISNGVGKNHFADTVDRIKSVAPIDRRMDIRGRR